MLLRWIYTVSLSSCAALQLGWEITQNIHVQLNRLSEVLIIFLPALEINSHSCYSRTACENHQSNHLR